MPETHKYLPYVSHGCQCDDHSARRTRGICHRCYAKQHRAFYPERMDRRSGLPQSAFRKPPLQGGVSASCRCASGTRRRGVCDPCWQWHHRKTEHGRALQIDAQKRYREKYPERAAASLRKWVESNRPARRKINQNYRMRNKDRVYLLGIKRKFGLSPAEYQELYDLQGGRCALCRIEESSIGERLCLDHDHRTNEPRGLVCRGCNLCLGFHERRATNAYKWYIEWTPVMRMRRLRELTPDEKAIWNAS